MTTVIHARHGWTGVCMIAAGLCSAALAFWTTTLKLTRSEPAREAAMDV